MSTIVRKAPVPKRVKPGTKAAPPSQAEPTAALTVIPLELLHRHADNRVITEASVEELAESLRTFGQKEPIRVRELDDPIGHYEILSGERRFVAAAVAGLDSLKCLIENHDGPEALLELAVANAHREDLDPIERAELLARLIAPQTEGGAGMPKAEAGKIFSLNSESGVKNALRLLSLPTFFRDLLKSQAINVKQARALVPYPDALLDTYAKWLTDAKNKHDYEDLLNEDGDLDWALTRFIRNSTRPADKLGEHNHGYQLGGEYPCLFAVDKLDAATRDRLALCEIPYRDGHGKNVKTGVRLVSLNPSAWHKIQDPLVKTAFESRAKKGKKDSKSSTVKNETAKPTAAELRAKRKKADEQLEHYTRDWIARALRYQCSAIASWTQDEIKVLDLLPWLLASSFDSSSYHLHTWNAWALVECGIEQKKSTVSRNDKSAVDFLKSINAADNIKFYAALWRCILWPSGNGSHYHPDLTPPGTIPERMPGFGTAQIGSLAEACGVSVETVWSAATQESMQRSLVRQWLTRHNKEQLFALGESLGVMVTDGKRDDMVAQIIDRHQHSPQKKPLKLPAMIAKIADVKKRAK